MGAIERLVAENYRGASTRLDLTFDRTRKVALVFGENGTGKSTVVDALDAIGNCATGSLSNRSSTSARTHLATIGRAAPDIRVEATSGSTTWVATLQGNSIAVAPEPRPRVRVLRRPTIESIVSGPPGERYEHLKRLLDVDNVERSEEALKAAMNSAKSDYDAAVRTRADAEQQLEDLWAAESKPGADSRAWAAEVASTSTEAATQASARLRAVHAAITAGSRAVEELRLAESDLDARRQGEDAVEEETQRLPRLDQQDALAVTSLLRQALDHFNQHPADAACPVCQQPVNTSALTAQLDERLADLAEYEAQHNRRQAARRAVESAENTVRDKARVLVIEARRLLQSIRASHDDLADLNELNNADYNALSEPSSDPTNGLDLAAGLVDQAAAQVAAIEQRVSAAELRAGQVTPVRQLHDRLEASIGKSEEMARIATALKDAYDAARLERIRFTQAALDDLAEECNRLYGQIHPGEPLAISKLALDESRRQSLQQGARFEGFNDVPPQAYFSESHLDTLGFCLWLASVAREPGAEDTVVVLDDVFTSVDAQHIKLVAQLVVEESHKFAQIVITTHQRLWRDIYRNSQGPGRLVDLIELQRWTMQRGITVYKKRLALKELADELSATPFDRQSTASKAGVLLEAVLDGLALQYRCRVPRTADNAYTLAELLDGTSSLFRVIELERPDPAAPGTHQKFSPRKVVEAIRECAFVRNQVGAHHNLAGAEISDRDVEEFAERVIELVESVSCDTCGQVPGKSRETHYTCSCPAPADTRLPLVR